MLPIATARTFKAQLKQVFNDEAERTKRVPITKEDILKGKDGQLRPKIPLYADQKTRAARNRAVYFGRRWLTARGGLDRTQLEPNANGRIVSKAARAEALKRGDFGKQWREAVKEACVQLGIEKYTIPKKGSDLYNATLSVYESKKNAAPDDQGGGETAEGDRDPEEEVAGGPDAQPAADAADAGLPPTA